MCYHGQQEGGLVKTDELHSFDSFGADEDISMICGQNMNRFLVHFGATGTPSSQGGFSQGGHSATKKRRL